MHLTLISLFENLFFWHFVSKSEDAALVSLVQAYTQGALQRCGSLTEQQRAIARDVFDLIFNQTRVDAAGVTAAGLRGTYNGILLQNSWLYFGGFLALFTGIATRHYKSDWPVIIGENITMVTLLGLYEWMFFSTVVLRYQSISMAELDRMVVDEFQQC